MIFQPDNIVRHSHTPSFLVIGYVHTRSVRLSTQIRHPVVAICSRIVEDKNTRSGSVEELP